MTKEMNDAERSVNSRVRLISTNELVMNGDDTVVFFSALNNSHIICLQGRNCSIPKLSTTTSKYKQGGNKRMLRSIQKAYEIIKADDPDTAVTLYTIRTWCKEGKIKCLYAGSKVLVDIDSLKDYIAPKN